MEIPPPPPQKDFQWGDVSACQTLPYLFQPGLTTLTAPSLSLLLQPIEEVVAHLDGFQHGHDGPGVHPEDHFGLSLQDPLQLRGCTVNKERKHFGTDYLTAMMAWGRLHRYCFRCTRSGTPFAVVEQSYLQPAGSIPRWQMASNLHLSRATQSSWEWLNHPLI